LSGGAASPTLKEAATRSSASIVSKGDDASIL
jgi:hypothetical protein